MTFPPQMWNMLIYQEGNVLLGRSGDVFIFKFGICELLAISELEDSKHLNNYSLPLAVDFYGHFYLSFFNWIILFSV